MGIESSLRKIDPSQEISMLQGAITISLNTLTRGNEVRYRTFIPWTPTEAQKAISGLIHLLNRRRILYDRVGNSSEGKKERKRILEIQRISDSLEETDTVNPDLLKKVKSLF